MPLVPLRLEVEINTREHFAVDGFIRLPFHVTSRWFEGSGEIPSYGADIGLLLAGNYQWHLEAMAERVRGTLIDELPE